MFLVNIHLSSDSPIVFIQNWKEFLKSANSKTGTNERVAYLEAWIITTRVLVPILENNNFHLSFWFGCGNE